MRLFDVAVILFGTLSSYQLAYRPTGSTTASLYRPNCCIVYNVLRECLPLRIFVVPCTMGGIRGLPSVCLSVPYGLLPPVRKAVKVGRNIP